MECAFLSLSGYAASAALSNSLSSDKNGYRGYN